MSNDDESFYVIDENHEQVVSLVDFQCSCTDPTFPYLRHACNVRWVGFDKYKKLVYGLHMCLDNGTRCEILMQSIFGGQPTTLKMFDVDADGETFGTVSGCGETICFIHLMAKYPYHLSRGSVFFFHAAEGRLEKYNILNQFGHGENDVEWSTLMSRLILLRPTSIGFVCSLPSDTMALKFYRLALHENIANSYIFEPLTSFNIPDTGIIFMVICDKHIMTARAGEEEKIKVYDLLKNTWSTSDIVCCKAYLSVPYRPNVTCYTGAVSGDDQRIFLVPTMFWNTFKECQLVELTDDNCVRSANIRLKFATLFPIQISTVTDFFTTRKVLFLHGRDDRRIAVANYDVLSLRDIAFKCIFRHMQKMENNDFVSLKFPTLMKRVYFGPPQYSRKNNMSTVQVDV